jgi:hypothetical protein
MVVNSPRLFKTSIQGKRASIAMVDSRDKNTSPAEPITRRKAKNRRHRKVEAIAPTPWLKYPWLK